MNGSGDIVNTLQTFKAVADNALTRSLLKALSRNCSRDNRNRLEVALELCVGARERACIACRLSQIILSPILKSACRGFGITEEKMKGKFRDAYWRAR